MAQIKIKGMPKGVTITDEIVQGVPCKVLQPQEAREGRVLLYFHGGGFCLGLYPASLSFVAEIARRSGVKVCLPDYRLAPEHPYPAALEDAAAVYSGLLGGHEPSGIVVAGDSSGCALAVSALLKARALGAPMPGRLVFITPLFDLAGTGETFQTRAAKDPFQLRDPLGIAKIYLAENDPRSPLLSPLYGELSPLPPMLLYAAGDDVFLSDAQRFAQKAAEAGVLMELRVFSGMWHIFPMQYGFVPEAGKALDELCADIRQSLNAD